MKNHFKSLNILSDEELGLMDTFLHKRFIKKGDYLIKQGEICKEIAFIKHGVLRSFFINEEGDETTNCITFENDLMNAFSSFIKQEPTQENIQAIIDTEIEFISKQDVEALFGSSITWQKVGRKLTKQQYLNFENRILSFLNDSAANRYINLAAKQPQYIQQIPLHYISSYLGISTRHLTRIRKSLL